MYPRLLPVLLALQTAAFAAPHDWPQWRGPDRSDVSRETGLLQKWPAGGPKKLWTFENAGNGYSGPAIVNGRLFTLGTRDGKEVVLALDAATGKEIWAAPMDGILANDWGGGPRGTPTVDGDRVYALSGTGGLHCLALGDGKVIWKASLKALGGSVPKWGYTESVLVDGNLVLATPGGGKGTVAALDKATGKLVWQSKELTDAAHYSSIVPAVIHGKKQYVQRTERQVFGLNPETGGVLWQTDFQGRTAVIPTPVVKDNFVYVTAGYGSGCKQVEISPTNTVRVVYENKVMRNHHGGVVLVGEHVFGHDDPSGWACQNFKTGEEIWKVKNLGKGAIAYADGRLYLLEENTGNVALIEASSQGWKEHGRFRIEPQTKIRSERGKVWTHPVISNGKLYLRDQDIIVCYDVKAG